METRLYVGNLPPEATSEELRATFARGGREVLEIQLVTDEVSGRPRGFAFVEMASEVDAAAARAEVDGYELAGRRLLVNSAHRAVKRHGW